MHAFWTSPRVFAGPVSPPLPLTLPSPCVRRLAAVPARPEAFSPSKGALLANLKRRQIEKRGNSAQQGTRPGGHPEGGEVPGGGASFCVQGLGSRLDPQLAACLLTVRVADRSGGTLQGRGGKRMWEVIIRNVLALSGLLRRVPHSRA
jgi:hypothetical protein